MNKLEKLKWNKGSKLLMTRTHEKLVEWHNEDILESFKLGQNNQPNKVILCKEAEQQIRADERERIKKIIENIKTWELNKMMFEAGFTQEDFRTHGMDWTIVQVQLQKHIISQLEANKEVS